jgi:DNA-binding PadR family transcriptional regulator
VPDVLPLENEFGRLLPALNAGQIYSTLARLERDGLIVGPSVAGDSRRKRVYELTESGRAALASRIETPVPGPRLKDEFFMKFVVVAAAGLAAELLVEGAVLHLKADLEWLDLIEQRLSVREKSA